MLVIDHCVTAETLLAELSSFGMHVFVVLFFFLSLCYIFRLYMIGQSEEEEETGIHRRVYGIGKGIKLGMSHSSKCTQSLDHSPILLTTCLGQLWVGASPLSP